MSFLFDDIKVLIICAKSKEFEQLELAFPEIDKTKQFVEIKGRRYVMGDIFYSNNKTSIKIVATCIKDQGRVSAALAVNDAINCIYKIPEFVILTGIAAAKPDSGYMLGDVTIGKKVLDYGEQKYTIKKDDNGKYILDIQYRAKEYPCWFDIDRFVPESFESNWHSVIDEGVKRTSKTILGRSFRWPPTYHFVTVASGDFVVNSSEKAKAILDKLSETRSDVDVLEMEAGGIGAAIDRLENKPKFLVIKGISDFAHEKEDTMQAYAANAAASFVRKLIEGIALYDPAPLPVTEKKIIATLAANPGWENVLQHFDYDNRITFKRKIVDGALEILSCPSEDGGPYGGIGPNKIKCEISDFEWPYNVKINNKGKWLKLLSAGLFGDSQKGIIGWLEKSKQLAKPNRIRMLRDVPKQPALDDRSLYFNFGNSDYFNYRAVHSLASQSQKDNDFFSEIFPKRWNEPEKPFPENCVPYHVSAQGIIISKDPETQSEYLILALTNPGTDTAVKGWEVTMSEQMWAPPPKRSIKPWWQDFVKDRKFDIDSPVSREGDKDITYTLIRGLKEEFKLEDHDFLNEPPLLGVLLEQNLYFLAFIYLVYVFLSPEDLYEKQIRAVDSKEIGSLAAYQITGYDPQSKKYLNGPRRLAELLANRDFTGSNYLLGVTETEMVAKPWHPTSRMRIFMAGCHLYKSEFDNYIQIERS